MSKYTTLLRNLIESNFDFQLNEYPIFDEDYRETLNKNILNHYYFREIAFETAGMFRHYLKSKMNEIMPFYNKLYESELIKFDPLNNYNLINKITSSAKSSSTGQSTSESLGINSETPQNFLETDSITNNTYASEANKGKGSGTSSSKGRASSNSSSETKGYSNYNPSEAIKKFRESFINIDLQIINELDELFFQIY